MNKLPPLARMYSRLKMRHIQLLKALGATSNIRKAAAGLNISQPVASTMLREIEDAMGVQLYDRTTRGLRSTAAGVAMARWASLLLSDLESARDDLLSISEGETRRLRIGISPLAAPSLLPRALSIFMLKFPRARFSIRTGIESDLGKALANGELDCAVCRVMPESTRTGILRDVLYSEGSDIVVRVGHPVAQAEVFVPTDLNSYGWILPVSQGDPYNLLAKRLLDTGCSLPRVVVESWSTLVIVNLLQGSDLISVLPRTIARHSARSGLVAVLPMLIPDSLFPLAVLSRSRIPSEDDMLQTFVDVLKQVAPECAHID